MKTIVAEKKEKLSELLLDYYAGGLSYAAFCKLLRKKDIKVNGKRTSADILLSPGDVVVCYFDGERRAAYGVIYKDENIVAVDKHKMPFVRKMSAYLVCSPRKDFHLDKARLRLFF